MRSLSPDPRVASMVFYARFVHRDTHGAVLWESSWVHNSLGNDGERNVLDTYLRNLNSPTQFFVKLFGDLAEETDSLTSLSNEPGGSLGYAPILIERSAVGWPTFQESGGDAEMLSKSVVFRATSGTWPNIQTAVLALTSDNSGRLIDFTVLPQAVQLASGSELEVAYRVKMS